jgi:hypothetical protein
MADTSEKFTHTGAHPEVTSATSSAEGIGNTVTAALAEAVHPFASVTVAVYVVLAEGMMFCVFPLRLPGVHTTFSAGFPPAGFEPS